MNVPTFLYSIICLLCCINCDFQSNKKTTQDMKFTIQGKAENVKMGAIIITSKNEVYYIDGLTEWNGVLLDKTLEVSGMLEIKKEITGDSNGTGLSRQKISGDQYIISNASWKIVE